MTYLLHRNPLACILIVLLFASSSLFSQSVEWEYEVQDELRTTAGNFWLDEEGNGYFNIRCSLIKGSSAALKESFLLKLDRHGQYDGSVVINQCTNRAPLYAFGRNRFITSGSNCTGDERPRKSITTDTRVFNHRGKLLRIGERFPGYTRGAVYHNDEITFFNKPHGEWGYTFLSIGRVSRDVEVSYDSVSLAPLAHDEYGISLASREPVATSNNTWVVPYSYGTIGGGRWNEELAVKHGLVMGIKDQEIQWTFPQQLDYRKVHALCERNDQIGLIRSSSSTRASKIFTLLDEDGNVLKTASFRAYSVRDMGMTDNSFIVMEAKKISWFSYDGELQTEFLFEEHGLAYPWRLEILPDGSLIFNARRGENAVIMKLRNDQLEEEPEEAVQPRAVSYSSFDEISSETISISVYPNPASIDITFEVDQAVDISSGFMLQIFSASGQLVHEATFNDQRHEVYVDELPAGTYFYRIAYRQDEERRLIQGKFIKV